MNCKAGNNNQDCARQDYLTGRHVASPWRDHMEGIQSLAWGSSTLMLLGEL